MLQNRYEIIENRALTPRIMRLRLSGDVSGLSAPGQFVQIRVPGFYLRRPFSVGDLRGESFTVHYERTGPGTEALSALPPGSRLDVLTGLGNGFDLTRAGVRPLLVGGGTGVSPLLWLARELVRRGARPSVCLGFGTKDDIFCLDDFEAMGIVPRIATVDGSVGVCGFVTAAIDSDHSFFYACGPDAMMKAVCLASRRSGQLSFDRRMGCGFGACMGCTMLTSNGPKRICRDGPVLDKEEVIWED